ncbi:MAG: ASCH domain-containing protein [Candidatus Methanomethylophilaceae archaeon]|nr:ASCH domain-containing protein [Candidatus Methanomethylophilaceae archaeon]
MPMIGYTLLGADQKILAGTKTSTIRLYTSAKYDRFAVSQIKGRKLYHYMYPRTKEMRLIAVTDIKDVEVFEFPKNSTLSEDLARIDGFASVREMYGWFFGQYGSTFPDRKYLRITWNPPEASP